MSGLLSLSITLALALGSQAAASKTAPSVVLEGVVRDSTGKAVKNALVSAHPESRSAMMASTVPIVTRTDDSGRFSLTLKSAGPHRIRAQAEGLAAQTVRKIGPGAPLTITLGKGLSIEGVIRDAQTKTPLAGARVDAREEGSRGSPDEPELGVVETLTDDRGYYRLEGLSAGNHIDGLTSRIYNVLAVSRAGSFALSAGVRPGAEGVELKLGQGGYARLRVQNAEGAPVVSARLRLLSVNGLSVMGFFIYALTGPDGGAEVSLPAGAVELEVTKEQQKTKVTISVHAGQTATADVVLTKGS